MEENKISRTYKDDRARGYDKSHKQQKRDRDRQKKRRQTGEEDLWSKDCKRSKNDYRDDDWDN